LSFFSKCIVTTIHLVFISYLLCNFILNYYFIILKEKPQQLQWKRTVSLSLLEWQDLFLE